MGSERAGSSMNTDKGTSRITSSAVVMHEMAASERLRSRKKSSMLHAKQRDDLAKLLSNQVSIREEDESDSSSSSSSSSHSLSDDDDDEEAEAAQQPKSVVASPTPNLPRHSAARGSADRRNSFLSSFDTVKRSTAKKG